MTNCKHLRYVVNCVVNLLSVDRTVTRVTVMWAWSIMQNSTWPYPDKSPSSIVLRHVINMPFCATGGRLCLETGRQMLDQRYWSRFKWRTGLPLVYCHVLFVVNKIIVINHKPIDCTKGLCQQIILVILGLCPSVRHIWTVITIRTHFLHRMINRLILWSWI